MSQEMILGLLIPFMGTVIGSAFVFTMKHQMNQKLQKSLLGFASGVMVAASVWSLLIPSMEFSAHAEGITKILPSALGFLAGMAFLLAIDHFTPHLHLDATTPEGPVSHLSRTSMLTLAVTIHNLPEGMAVGVILAGMANGHIGIEASAVIAMSLGIAFQNIPEGAIVSMPLRTAGNSRKKAFLIGCLSGVVEPIGALIVILLTAWFTPLIPYTLAFAAGSMLYVVIEELIPEASEGAHSNLSTIGFALGFVLMMTLDTLL